MLWSKLAQDCADWCCTSTIRDIKTVADRFEHEGVSFLTITLPAFGKDFERSLSRGRVDHTVFTGFRFHGGLPRFLGGYLGLVFDRRSGVLLDSPDVDAIIAIRQLTLFCGKISLRCSDKRRRDAMSRYVVCEQEVRTWDQSVSHQNMLAFRRMSRVLFADVLTEADRRVYQGMLIPKHGPGATADGFRGNGKYRHKRWTVRLEAEFPFGDYLFPSPSYYQDFEGVELLEPGLELPVRVVSVPKTLKTPRVIGIEPTCMQYMQQAVLPVILDALSSRKVRGRQRSNVQKFLNAAIGFDDQTPNQEMARRGSMTQDLATIDLQDASDRVSMMLVREMLADYPNLYRAVYATRSLRADVPGHGIISLAKFASMGSALCFPIEAMVFMTVILVGIERGLNTSLGRKDLLGLIGRVRVFGDDIIVPVESVRSVVTALETFGSRVNRAKSFWTGKFRESCGKEYFDGEDVSIVRAREPLPSQRKHASEIISAVELRNQLYQAGRWRTVRWLDELLTGILRYFPNVSESSTVLGRQCSFAFQAEKYGRDLQNPLVKGWKIRAKIPSDQLEGYDALTKFFLKPVGTVSDDERHLERAGRPLAVNIKLGYGSPV